MKQRAFLLLTFVIPMAALAAQSPPDVEILKFSWRKLPKDNGPHASAKKLQDMKNANIDARISAENRKDNPDMGVIRDLERQKDNQITPPDQPRPQGGAYEYKFRFRNSGRKPVIALKWMYVFKDSVTGEELVRHHFETKLKIAPGKEQGVTALADSSPPLIVSATATEKTGKPWKEEAILEEVKYADGSIWHRQ